jgi:hypothetical protein
LVLKHPDLVKMIYLFLVKFLVKKILIKLPKVILLVFKMKKVMT